jgi:hypothetical protein
LSEPALFMAHHAAQAGNTEARQLATYFVGQIVGSMNEVKSTRDVMFEMIDELIDTNETVSSKISE